MTLSRRDLLRASALAGGGLLIGFRLGAGTGDTGAPFAPNAWLRVHPDGRVVVVVGKSEMGQGVRTSLSTVLIEELDADPARVEIEQARPGPEFPRLGTGGSGSVMGSWDPLRLAAAAAREMLVAAAAAAWRVPVSDCRADRGTVRDLGGRVAAYGDLAAAAALQPVPAEPRLKPRAAYRWIGRPRPRVDGPAIVTGAAVYGVDVRLPGMLRAVVARPPSFGAELVSFEPSRALELAGVRAAFAIASGVAVVGDTTWAALAGRDALSIEWRAGASAGFSSVRHLEALAAAVAEPGITTRRDGRGRAAVDAASSRLEATYLYPFEAHASIEPVGSTAHVRDGRCEIWSGTQTPNAVQRFCAAELGLPPEAVTVHVALLGGAFGRRLGWDFDLEAVRIAQRVDAPVQLVWTREDDLVHGYFQAASAHRLRAGFDAGGALVAWEHRKASTPHNARSRPSPEQLADPEFLAGSSWGVVDTPYAIADLETSYRVVAAPVPIGPWRAVFSPSSVFARESFVDEVAERLGRDPLELRRALLGRGDPGVPAVIEPAGDRVDRRRLLAVLELAAERAGWREPLAKGHARGLACNVFHTETYVAYVVEASLRRAPRPGELPFAVERVTVALDCGLVLDPAGVAQQVESGAVWSLSNAIGEITFDGGRARESNFDGFRIATLAETPPIDVHLVDSDDDRPHGVGEPVVCPFAPALTNALSRLAGRRLRRLPIAAVDLA